MSKTKAGKRRKSHKPRRKSLNRRKVVAVIGLILCLGLTTLILARWRTAGVMGRTTSMFSPVPQSQQSLSPSSPSKEYIYAGGRLVAIEGAAGVGGGTAYNAVTDFSASQNPYGPWSYGYKTTSVSTLNLYATHNYVFGPALETWTAGGSCCPMVVRNNTGATLTYPTATSVTQPVDLLNLHPGPLGEKSVVRWTAPTSGTYSIAGRFQGLDSVGGTTTDVTILHNSATIFTGNINGYGNQANFSLAARPVVAGDTIDFQVGWGSNNGHSYDSTGLAATITSTTTGSNDIVWVEDAVPAGATSDVTNDSWSWVSSNPAQYSGTVAHQSGITAGVHQHFFYSASQTLTLNAGDKLFTYVYLDPANPPSEIMLQWKEADWDHRAYWGANIIPWGTDATDGRRYMGALPAVGQWVRLEVDANQVGLSGKSINGMAFTLYNGRATWDHAGKSSQQAPPPTGNDSVWVEDAVPAGATSDVTNDSWSWISSNPAQYSGTSAHQSSNASGTHQHYFYGATNTLTINSGDKLIVYVYIDPANVPQEIMLQWKETDWDHRAYWGTNLIPWGTDGSDSRRYMGPLPIAGQWIRLEVPASQVGLSGKIINGMAFTLFDGRATWDYAGKSTP
jgi:hypothetical protein